MCYTLHPRLCNKGPTLWGIQLQAAGVKRSLLKVLNRLGVCVGYDQIQNAFKDKRLMPKEVNSLSSLHDGNKAQNVGLNGETLEHGLERTEEDKTPLIPSYDTVHTQSGP